MNLFGFGGSSMNDDMAIAPKFGDGKVYKTVRAVAMGALILVIILVVLEAFQIFNLNSTANGLICTVGVIGLGGLTVLPWVRVLEAFDKRRYKTIAIVFMALMGVCVVLWIVCVWMIIDLIQKGMSSSSDADILEGLLDSLNIIRIAIIISLQFLIASPIAMNVVKYNKKMLTWQVIAGVSALYIDFYVVLLITAFTITKDGAELSDTAIFLTHKIVHALFAIALILSIFPSVVFKRTDRRNLLEARNNMHAEPPAPQDNEQPVDPFDDDRSIAPAREPAETSVDEKLRKLKDLLDKGLITQEEYDAKRADIINSI